MASMPAHRKWLQYILACHSIRTRSHVLSHVTRKLYTVARSTHSWYLKAQTPHTQATFFVRRRLYTCDARLVCFFHLANSTCTRINAVSKRALESLEPLQYAFRRGNTPPSMLHSRGTLPTSAPTLRRRMRHGAAGRRCTAAAAAQLPSVSTTTNNTWEAV